MKFVVIVNIQGQPVYYQCKTLLGAMWKYLRKYLDMHSLNTCNIVLREILITDDFQGKWNDYTGKP